MIFIIYDKFIENKWLKYFLNKNKYPVVVILLLQLQT